MRFQGFRCKIQSRKPFRFLIKLRRTKPCLFLPQLTSKVATTVTGKPTAIRFLLSDVAARKSPLSASKRASKLASSGSRCSSNTWASPDVSPSPVSRSPIPHWSQRWLLREQMLPASTSIRSLTPFACRKTLLQMKTTPLTAYMSTWAGSTTATMMKTATS